MSILNFIKDLFKPAVELVDNLHTSKEEKLVLHNELAMIENNIVSKVLDYETAKVNAQRDIIVAEAEGKSWLQRNWRPMLMVSITAIIVNNYIIFPYVSIWTDKVVVLELPKALFGLMTVGVGGYIVGRSGEKIIEKYKR